MDLPNVLKPNCEPKTPLHQGHPQLHFDFTPLVLKRRKPDRYLPKVGSVLHAFLHRVSSL